MPSQIQHEKLLLPIKWTAQHTWIPRGIETVDAVAAGFVTFYVNGAPATAR